MTETIKVYVGCAPDGEDAESLAVLEYTLRKHASRPVEIVWMRMSRDPDDFWWTEPNTPGAWQSQLWSTPFSAFRYGIPAHCNYEGQAIYCDSDVIFMDDIAKLWDEPFQPGKMIIAKGGSEGWRFCVSKWNCAEAVHLPISFDRIKALPDSAERLKGFLPAFTQPFSSGNWNCVDLESYPSPFHPDIKAIHYSSMDHQPHLKYAIPRLEQAGRKHWFDGVVKPHWRQDLITLFDQLLLEAADAGFTPASYIPNQLYGNIVKQSQAGYVGGHQWAQ